MSTALTANQPQVLPLSQKYDKSSWEQEVHEGKPHGAGTGTHSHLHLPLGRAEPRQLPQDGPGDKGSGHVQYFQLAANLRGLRCALPPAPASPTTQGLRRALCACGDWDMENDIFTVWSEGKQKEERHPESALRAQGSRDVCKKQVPVQQRRPCSGKGPHGISAALVHSAGWNRRKTVKSDNVKQWWQTKGTETRGIWHQLMSCSCCSWRDRAWLAATGTTHPPGAETSPQAHLRKHQPFF